MSPTPTIGTSYDYNGDNDNDDNDVGSCNESWVAAAVVVIMSQDD